MNIFDNIDYAGYDTTRKILVNKLGDISKVYKAELPQLFWASEEYFASVNFTMSEIIEKIKKATQEHSIAIQQTTFLKKKNKPYPINEKDDFFKRENKRFHESIPQKISETYFTITLKAPRGKPRGLFYNLFNKNVNVINHNKYDANLYQIFKEITTNFESSMNFVKGVTLTEVGVEDLNKLIYNTYYNLDLKNEDIELKNIKSFVEHPYKDYVHVGNTFMKTYSVAHNGIKGYRDPETETSGHIFETLLSSTYEHNIPQSFLSDAVFGSFENEKIVTVAVIIEPTNRIIKHLKENEQIYSYTDKSNNKEFIAVSPSNIEDLNLVYMHIGISILGESEPQFLKETSSFEKHMNECGFELSINYKTNIQQFYTFAFGNIHNLAFYERCILPAKIATRLFLYENLKEIEQSDKGIHFKQRYSNNDYYLDLLNAQSTNKNAVLFGFSGTGKSVTLGYMIESFWNDGATVYLTDIGFSQQNLCKKLGGVYIEITEKNPVKLNPFVALNFDEDKRKYTLFDNTGENDIDFLVTLLFTCWNSGERNITAAEETTINKTIIKYITYLNKLNAQKDTYQAPQKANFQEYYHYTQELFQEDREFVNLTESVFNKESYLLVLSDYLKKDLDRGINENGRYYFLFDEDESVGNQIKNNRFVVFEFEHITENDRLSNISSFLVSNMVKKRMLSQTHVGKKLVYIKDECHKFIQTKGAVNHSALAEIEYAFRTFRKHNASMIIATQSISDLFATDKGKTIIENSSIKLIKKQAKEGDSMEYVKGALKFTDSNLKKLYSIPENQKKLSLFIEVEGNSVVLNIILDKYSLALAETAKDVRTELLREIEQANGQIDIAVQNLIEEGKNKVVDTKKLLID